MTNEALSLPWPGFTALLPLLPLMAKVSILFVTAFAIHAAMGRRRVLVRSGLWNAVLLAAILLPLECLTFPRQHIGWIPGNQSTATVPAAIAAGVSNDAPAGGFNREDLGFRPSPLNSPKRLQSGRSESLRVETGPDISAFMVTTLVGIYAAGVILLSIRLGASLLAVAKLKKGSLAVESPAWIGALARWRNRLGISRRVSLIRSAQVRVPLLLGWRRPAIVIACADEHDTALGTSQVDSILLHELAHLQRRDDLWNLFQQVVQILYWPHPLIWWAGRVIGGVREQACDDLCVRWIGDAEKYRDVLVGVASRLIRKRTDFGSMSLGLTMAQTSSSALLRRLAWIGQTEGLSSPLLSLRWRMLIGVLVLSVAGSLATIELSRAGAVQAEDAVARAYQQPVPNSVKFHTVTLTVLDDETSKPLADTQVMVLNDVDLRYHSFRTDARGRLMFEYPYVGAIPMLNLELRKNGYVPLRHFWGPGPDSRPAVDTLVIRLRRGTTMGGTVVHAQDQPVEGVTVVMSVRTSEAGRRGPNPTGYEIYYEVPSVTDRNGRWRSDSVPPGAESVSLQLIHPDFVSDGCTTLGGPGRSPKLDALRDQSDRQVMLKGVKISGRVIDGQGRPVAGAEVVDSSRGLTRLTYVQRAFTDVDGTFHLHLPHNSNVSLTVTAKDLAPVTVQVTAEIGAAPLQIRLAKGRTLKARIVDVDRSPVAGAYLIIPVTSNHKGIFLRRWSDRDGRVSWDSAPHEKVEYSIGAQGYAWQQSVTLAAGEGEVVVVLEPQIDVRLHVIDAETREPIARASVRTGVSGEESPEMFWWPPSLANAQGEYRAAVDSKKRPFRFEVSAEGYETMETRTFQGGERKVREIVRINRKKS